MNTKGILYLTIATLTFGFSYIFDKFAIQSGVNPTAISLGSIFIGFVTVLIAWIARRQHSNIKWTKKTIGMVAILGIIGSGIVVLIRNYALTTTTATNAGVMQGLYTALTMLIAFFWLHERLPKSFFPTLTIMIGGLILLTSDGLRIIPTTGDWMLLLLVPMIGFCNVFGKKIMKHLPALDTILGRLLFGSLFLLISLFFVGFEFLYTIKEGFIWVLLSGLFNGIRLVTFFKGIQLEGPTIAATALTIGPAITAVAAFLFLGEVLSFIQITGLVIILAGALILIRLKATYKEPIL